MIKPRLSLLIATTLLPLFSGCASPVIGNKTYACRGYPSQPLCRPPSEVYQLTHARALVEPREERSER